jgi:fructose-bisphosphate aldolase, class I
MKPIDTLDGLLERANRHAMFGTKMRSVIKDADSSGISAIADQQFDYATDIWGAGLVPILEPEVAIDSPHKEEAEKLRRIRSARQGSRPDRELLPGPARGPVRRAER